MLLEFKGNNFKSFGTEFDFRMTTENRLTELLYSILSEMIGKKEVKALSASVIYGPNAAGKTSIINAMSCFRQIVLRGNIRNSETDRTNDHVSANMNLIPFKFNDEIKPVVFDILFTYGGFKYRYLLSFVVGRFLQDNFKRYIDNEQLWINDKKIYERSKNKVDYLDVSSLKDELNIGYDKKNTVGVQKMMSENITRESLLLTTDFNSFCSKTVVSRITKWFEHDFLVVNSSNHAVFLPNNKEGTAVIDSYINKIAKEAGILGSDFAYVNDAESHEPKLVTVLSKDDQKISGIDATKIESAGTMRLISIMPVVLRALKTGATLVMDEFDASLHPSIIMNLISIFHNDEVNINHAQLIFNSHNPLYLNNKLLRRDEIKFVERNEETQSSELYELADFRTNGETSVRKTSDYMKNYFVNRYGAIIDMDFTDIITDMMKQNSEAQDNE